MQKSNLIRLCTDVSSCKVQQFGIIVLLKNFVVAE